MNNERLKQELMCLAYTDETDVVALRYLLLQSLAWFAAEYKSMAGTREALSLLQQYRQLETLHAGIKEKCRNNCAGETDFRHAKTIALEHVASLISYKTIVAAA